MLLRSPNHVFTLLLIKAPNLSVSKSMSRHKNLCDMPLEALWTPQRQQLVGQDLRDVAGVTDASLPIKTTQQQTQTWT